MRWDTFYIDFDSATTKPIDSRGCGFMKNADSLHVLAMVKNANLQHDGFRVVPRKGSKVELLLPEASLRQVPKETSEEAYGTGASAAGIQQFIHRL
jgi:hypothetical protein